jgi:hypothetical protein
MDNLIGALELDNLEGYDDAAMEAAAACVSMGPTATYCTRSTCVSDAALEKAAAPTLQPQTKMVIATMCRG